VLSLLPVVAISAPSVAPEPSADPISRPYLTTVGSPALRFGEPIPPPDLTVRPAAAAPPQPSDDHVVTEASKADVTVTPPVATPAVETAPAAASTKPAAPGKPPSAILPDDTRPKVRAEDFLPFFQFPTSAPANGDVTVVAPVSSAPAPAPMPASSATYRQQ
jgi:hypothetical protein